MYRIEEIIISWFSELMKKIKGRHFLVAIPYGWVFVFFICPCLILIRISLAENLIASPPYTSLIEWISGYMLQIRINLGNYMVLFTDEMYIRGFATSILIAGTSTICCLLMGFPMAYAIARSSEKIRGILLMLVVLPFWTSFLIRVYAWIMLLSPCGFINNLLIRLNLIEAPLQLMNNSCAACIGIIYAYLPFMIFPLYSAIEKIDYTLMEAAYDLGSSPLKAFFSIVVPLAIPGIYAGSALVFVPAIGEFVIPELLGGAQTLTIGRLVWNEFFGNMSWPTAASLSIILLIFVVFPIVFAQRRREAKLSIVD
ncbi:MAG: ABC transporter permease subunit [Holosporaceae bacterium]|jgi:putrescine transport system permease protein|nr:ABC transporter permease subunit [Holosporaceae bacterium]